jgi:hypothetical protein
VPDEATLPNCRSDLHGRFLDKPLLCAGPRPGGGPESVYVFYSDYATEPWPESTPRIVGQTATPGPLAWSPGRIDVRRPGGTLDEEGTGAAPVVLGGGEHAGRIVCAWRPNFPTGGTPVCMYSDDGGASWGPSAPMALDQCGADPIYPVEARDLPAELDEGANTLPSIAADPVDWQRVYVAFWGKSTPWGGNVDLYIAQSLDGGATFLPANTLHLTDAHLGDTAAGTQVDEVMPAVAVDRFHGVDLFWYAMIETEQGVMVQPKWARIASFSGSVTPAQVFRQALGPSFALPESGGEPAPLGDYYTIASSGCLVYAVWMGAQEGSMNIYVSRMSLCPADVVADGVLDAADVAAFTRAYAAGDLAADLNHDGVVDARDLALFLESMSCDCAGGP